MLHEYNLVVMETVLAVKFEAFFNLKAKQKPRLN